MSRSCLTLARGNAPPHALPGSPVWLHMEEHDAPRIPSTVRRSLRSLAVERGGVRRSVSTHPSTSPFGYVPPGVRAVMRGNRNVATLPERRLQAALHRTGHRFRSIHPEFVQGRATSVNIAFNNQRLAIFVDGCFWHRCPHHGTEPRTNAQYWSRKLARNVARDATDNERLASEGWHVLRFWEHVPVEAAAAEIGLVLNRLPTVRAT